MVTMVERVARALCRADGKDPDAPRKISACVGEISMMEWQYHYPFMALRAIEAMREPTDEMVRAVESAEDDSGYIAAAGEHIDWGDAWTIAINAALQKETPTE